MKTIINLQITEAHGTEILFNGSKQECLDFITINNSDKDPEKFDVMEDGGINRVWGNEFIENFDSLFND